MNLLRVLKQHSKNMRFSFAFMPFDALQEAHWDGIGKMLYQLFFTSCTARKRREISIFTVACVFLYPSWQSNMVQVIACNAKRSCCPI